METTLHKKNPLIRFVRIERLWKRLYLQLFLPVYLHKYRSNEAKEWNRSGTENKSKQYKDNVLNFIFYSWVKKHQSYRWRIEKNRWWEEWHFYYVLRLYHEGKCIFVLNSNNDKTHLSKHSKRLDKKIKKKNSTLILYVSFTMNSDTCIINGWYK